MSVPRGGAAVSWSRRSRIPCRELNRFTVVVSFSKVENKDANAVTVLGADGSSTVLAEAPKDDIADAVWSLVVARLV